MDCHCRQPDLAGTKNTEFDIQFKYAHVQTNATDEKTITKYIREIKIG